MKNKDKFLDILKLKLLRAEICGYKLHCLQSDDIGRLICIILQSFCQKKGIKIGYVAPSIYKANGLVEQC